MSTELQSIYGTAEALFDISLSIWDGSGKINSFKKGTIFNITYYEFNGAVGYTDTEGIEYCVDFIQRQYFKENWYQ